MADTNFSPGTVVASSWLDDVNTDTYSTLTAVGGTANAITATGPSSMAAYPIGIPFRFTPTLANTGATTINISGIGAVNLMKYGTTALVAGDLIAGSFAQISYDGTRFQLINPRTADVSVVSGTLPITNGGTGATTAPQALINLGATGRLIAVRAFTATGVYTPTPGTNSILLKMWGAGGAGGGNVATAAGQISLGGGGGAGGFVEAYISSGFSGQTLTIGPGGVAVSGGTGGTGGTSFFMTFSATGGGGGGAGAAGAVSAAFGGVGGVGTGGTVNANGQAGLVAVGNFATAIWLSGSGGTSSPLGSSGGPQQASGATRSDGITATGRAAGGGGAVAGNGQVAGVGGAGAPGYAIIYEYS